MTLEWQTLSVRKEALIETESLDSYALVEFTMERWFIYLDTKQEGFWQYTNLHYPTKEEAMAMAVALVRLS